jgi:uncharacterized protein (DUF305 family)
MAQVPDHSNMKGMENRGGHGMNMDLGPADATYDLRFIDAMMPHHQGAVEMAKQVLQKSQRPEVRTLANKIIKAQDKEIAEMKQWRKAWYPKIAEMPMAWYASMGHMMPMSQDQQQGMMMSQDLGPANAEFDLHFINAMIPHHEGAVVMAKDALDKSNRPEIQKLAKAIIASQQAEIEKMKKWRQVWYDQ